MIKEVKQALAFCFVMAAGMIGASLAPHGNVLARTKRAQAAPQAMPTASSTIAIPFAGSVKDDAGATWAVSGTAIVTKTEPAPPVPSGIVFGQVRDTFGAVLTAATSGKVLFLAGAGFPAMSPPGPSDSLRLTLAGRAVIVAAWTPTSIQWGLSSTWTDTLTVPVTGPFEIWSQTNGVWKSLGKGGTFTVNPSHP